MPRPHPAALEMLLTKLRLYPSGVRARRELIGHAGCGMGYELVFTADTARDPKSATYLYELVK